MRRPASDIPIAHDTYTRPKCLLRRFVSMAIHCLSKTDAPLNGVLAMRSGWPPCVTFHAVAVAAPRGRTAIAIPDRASEGLTLADRKKWSPEGRYENMYGRRPV